jgi:SAM-dependent methyltransferase
LNDQEFRLLDEIEESHWWFVGKRLILRALFDSYPKGLRFLDLGCGTGGILRDWMGDNTCLGVDRSPLALKICKKNGFGSLVRGDLTQLPLRPDSFDIVMLMDVIEHLPDDVGFLRDVSRVCSKGGRVVIAVPAFQLLWSQHDVTFEHHRRYSASQLEKVARAAGLEPERITFTNSLLFPVALVWRLLSYRLGLGRFAPKHDFWPIPRWLNALLTQLYKVEAWLLRRMDLPVGVSVVCIARKP